MTGTPKHIAAVALAALMLAGAGCAAPPSVFDKPAIDKVRKLMVLPLQSSGEPSAGAIVSGMIAMRLQSARLAKISVIEAPALWRLAAASQPADTSPSDQAAVTIARQAGADAALVGAAGYTVLPPALGNMPAPMRDSAKAMEFQKKFAERYADAAVTVRLLSAETGRPIYVHVGTTKGRCDAQLFRDALATAMKPLEQYLGGSR